LLFTNQTFFFLLTILIDTIHCDCELIGNGTNKIRHNQASN